MIISVLACLKYVSSIYGHLELTFKEPLSTGLFPSNPLRKKCPYSELYCSVFSRIQTEYGEI